jgi:hypothetical protein
VAELALDDVQRHALARELGRVRVAKLMRREPTSDARLGSDPPELAADRRGRPRSPARRAVDDAKHRPHWQLDAGGEPRAQLLPAPLVHPDLAPPATLAPADEQRPAVGVEVALGERERFMRSPARHSTTIIARSLHPWRSSAVWRMTATISSTVGGSAG